jgi:hypothetical protein
MSQTNIVPSLSPAELNSLFFSTKSVYFLAREYTYLSIGKSSISFGDTDWLSPVDTLPLLGIFPNDLRKVFNYEIEYTSPVWKRVLKRFLSRDFLNKYMASVLKQKKIRKPLPKFVSNYQELMFMRMKESSFIALAKVLQKPIDVLREIEGGFCEYCYRVYPSGKVQGPPLLGDTIC